MYLGWLSSPTPLMHVKVLKCCYLTLLSLNSRLFRTMKGAFSFLSSISRILLSLLHFAPNSSTCFAFVRSSLPTSPSLRISSNTTLQDWPPAPPTDRTTAYTPSPESSGIHLLRHPQKASKKYTSPGPSSGPASCSIANSGVLCHKHIISQLLKYRPDK